MSRCQVCETAPVEADMRVELPATGLLPGRSWVIACCLTCPDTAAPAYAALGATTSVLFAF